MHQAWGKQVDLPNKTKFLPGRWAVKEQIPVEVPGVHKEGREVSNKDYLGRYFMVVFWEESGEKAAGRAVMALWK